MLALKKPLQRLFGFMRESAASTSEQAACLQEFRVKYDTETDLVFKKCTRNLSNINTLFTKSPVRLHIY